MEKQIESKINAYLVGLYPNYNIIGKSDYKDSSCVLCSDLELFGFHIKVYSFKKLCDQKPNITNIVWNLS